MSRKLLYLMFALLVSVIVALPQVADARGGGGRGGGGGHGFGGGGHGFGGFHFGGHGLARTVRSNDILQVSDAAGEPVDAGDNRHVPFS